MTRRTLFRSLVGLAVAPVAVKAAPAAFRVLEVSQAGFTMEAVRGDMLTVNEVRRMLDFDLTLPGQPMNTGIERCAREVLSAMEELHGEILEDLIISGDPDAPKPQGILRAHQ